MSEAVLQKIQKLLALTASPNENEARNAAAKACKMILEHKVTLVMKFQPAPPPPPPRPAPPPPPTYRTDESDGRERVRSYPPPWRDNFVDPGFAAAARGVNERAFKDLMEELFGHIKETPGPPHDPPYSRREVQENFEAEFRNMRKEARGPDKGGWVCRTIHRPTASEVCWACKTPFRDRQPIYRHPRRDSICGECYVHLVE